MFELWVKFSLWTDYIIPLIVIAIIILITLASGIHCLVDSFKWERKIKWLKSHNFERSLIGVPGCGNGAFYGWEHKETKKHIDERDLKRLKYKDFVKQMEI